MLYHKAAFLQNPKLQNLHNCFWHLRQNIGFLDFAGLMLSAAAHAQAWGFRSSANQEGDSCYVPVFQ